MPSSTAWSRKRRRPARASDLARRLSACGLVLLAGFAAAGTPTGAPQRARPVVSTEFLSDVLRDFRRAKQAGRIGVAARLAFAERAFAVAEVARGRERYEALRFVARLDEALDSAELLAARDRALERVVQEFQDDGDLMGEFVLRVLRDDAHDRAVQGRVFAATNSAAVRAACELRPVEPVLERALDEGDVTKEERDALLAVLARIAQRYPDAKHPLSSKTWGACSAEFAAVVRDLVLLGEPAPELAGVDLAGRAVRLADFAGQAVLVCFWGEWCEPCRPLHARLRALRALHPARDLALLGVDSDPRRETLAEASRREAHAWPNLWDGPLGTAGPLATRWRVRGWPTWFLVDRAGVVRRRWQGAPGTEECARALEEALSAAR